MPKPEIRLEEVRGFIESLSLPSGNQSYIKHYSYYAAPRYLESIQWLKEHLRGKRILDLGAAPFAFSTLLEEFLPGNSVFVNCLDFSRPSLRAQVKSRIKSKLGIRPGKPEAAPVPVRIPSSATGRTYHLDSYRFDMEKTRFPFADESMDVVLSMEVLEHLREDPMFKLSEANRVLPLGGLLFVTTPNSVSWSHVWKAMNMNSPRECYCFTPGGRGNVMEYSPAELRWYLESGGFEIVRSDTSDFIADDAPSGAALEMILGTQEKLRKLTRGHDILKLDVCAREEVLEAKEWTMSMLRSRGLDVSLRGLSNVVLARKIGPVRERYPAGIYTPALWN